MLSGQNQAMGYNVFFAVVCLYCYGSIVHIAYLYKVVHQSWLLDHIVFKFQLRAHAKLIIPLAVEWNNKVIFPRIFLNIFFYKSSNADYIDQHQ